MALDTKAGTRGSRNRPPGPLARIMSSGLGKLHRRQGYRFQGMDVLLLSTLGKRSGQLRTVPVSWFADGDDAWLIVASAGGSIENPGWYYNIAAHPDQVSIELKGDRKLKVVAEQLEGEPRAQAWERIIAAQPRYAKYQEKTDREIAVIRLTPAGA